MKRKEIRLLDMSSNMETNVTLSRAKGLSITQVVHLQWINFYGQILRFASLFRMTNAVVENLNKDEVLVEI